MLKWERSHRVFNTFMDHLNKRADTDDDGSSDVPQQDQTSFTLFKEKKQHKSQTKTCQRQQINTDIVTTATQNTQTRLPGVTTVTIWDSAELKLHEAPHGRNSDTSLLQ